jgi:copper chaperone
MQETFQVPDVSCDHCKSAIEGALSPVTGVEQAEVDVPGKSVVVTYDPASVDRSRLVEAIEGAGYSVAN